jgi:hypothetical protein
MATPAPLAPSSPSAFMLRRGGSCAPSPRRDSTCATSNPDPAPARPRRPGRVARRLLELDTSALLG